MAHSKHPHTSDHRNASAGDTIYCEGCFLGEGGFGKVYKGFLRGRTVAVKRILRDNYQRVEKELLSFSHPNLIQYLAIWDNADESPFVFITMEYCIGTLEDVIRNTYKGPNLGPMEELLLQTSLGLEALHSKNIIHRDIKPKNILISAVLVSGRRDAVKLADFGLSKLRKDDKSSFSKSADIIGTLGWAAPESINSEATSITYSADVFSLGCVFGYALTGGSHPFGYSNKYERAAKIEKGEINGPYVVLEYVIESEHMKEMIRLMISNKPEERPPISLVIQNLHLALERATPTFDCKELEDNKFTQLLRRLKRHIDCGYDLFHLIDEDGSNLLMILFKYWDKKSYEVARIMHREIIDILLSDAGVSIINVKHKDNEWKNTLHYLCQYYDGNDIVEIAKRMIDRGISATDLDAYSKTPLDYHLNSPNEKSMELIETLLKQQ